MTRKYKNDPAIRGLEGLVSDKDMLDAFTHTNFGHTDYRGLLAQGCLKALAEWHQGHTLTCILIHLGLITTKKDKSNPKVTDKGRMYLYYAFKNRPGV